MSFRASLKNLIRRDPAASLRERAADLQARIPAPKPSAEAPAPVRAEQVAQAGSTGDVLAVSGIDHRDGTVSYADATGKVSRRSMGRWVAFNAFQMHSHVQAEIGRRRVTEANPLPADERAAWEAKIRRELRADAVSALTLYPERAFQAEQDRRSGAEPQTAAGRAETDAMLVALAPEWEAARDAYAAAIQRQNIVSDTANSIEPPPSRDRPHQEWLRLVQGWRERTGVEEVEAASGEALDVLCEIEDRIAALPAASLAGLRLKALVAQRSDDLGLDWSGTLGEGLARDILALTQAQAKRPTPAGPNLVDMLDLASATMTELQTVREVAQRIGDGAYAHAWWPRCKRSVNAYGVSGFNDAGKLVQWIGDVLTDVETAANNEARRRRPADRSDRETRLEMLAPPVIQNGDPDQIEAFADELLAHAAAERRGR